MENEYKKENIQYTYYTIVILDSCGDPYDEIYKDHTTGKEFTNIRECAKLIIEMKKHDKELCDEYGVWDYRICKHEEDKTNDWQTVFKVYKYRGVWKVKIDERW